MSMTDFQVFAKVTTQVGVFTGFVSGNVPTLDDAVIERNSVQEMLRNCDSFTFFSDTSPGTEITLGQEVIANSVFEMSIVQGLSA